MVCNPRRVKECCEAILEVISGQLFLKVGVERFYPLSVIGLPVVTMTDLGSGQVVGGMTVILNKSGTKSVNYNLECCLHV